MTLQFENENNQVILVEPETVEAVEVADWGGLVGLVIGPLRIMVHGQGEAVAKRIGDERRRACPVVKKDLGEPPPSSFPAGDPETAPAGEPPPDLGEGEHFEPAPEAEPPAKGRPGGKHRKK